MNVKVGTLLIEQGTVHKVHKIVVNTNKNSTEKIVHYKPFYKSVQNTTLDCSIPETSISESNMRLISTKEEINSFYKLLSSIKTEADNLNLESATQQLTSNNISVSANVIKYFWKHTSRLGDSATKSQIGLLIKSIDSVVEEVSYVTENTLENTRKKIKNELNKYFKSKVVIA